MIKDSGERTEFASGAVRDMSDGKGDMMFVEEKQPELIDLPERKGKNRFKYFE